MKRILHARLQEKLDQLKKACRPEPIRSNGCKSQTVASPYRKCDSIIQIGKDGAPFEYMYAPSKPKF